jgi:Tfp pilus assembly protein PilF
MKLPNVIFCNLVCSGSSALDPILRDLLEPMGYLIIRFGPEQTHRLPSVLSSTKPVYHWTHDPLRTFFQMGLVNSGDCKFIFLHRDLRDVAVSWTKDALGKNLFPGKTERDALESIITHTLPPFVAQACEWVGFSRLRPDICREIRFDEIKNDIRTVLEKIFTHLGIKPSEPDIQASIRKHSFETLTGRRRGDDGPPIRGVYFLRKGISGEWRNYFDADLQGRFRDVMGKQLIDLGWADDPNWGRREFQIVSAPFSSGVAWLINILWELNIRTTNKAFISDQWVNVGEGVEVGPKAYDQLRWHLPILHGRKKFSFESELEILWEHRLDFAQYPDRPTILYVRDPRDAIYSLYRRSYARDLPFIEYLRRADNWTNHFPGLFNLPPADTWAYFNFFWLAMRDVMNVTVIRFEDMRGDPLGITRKVLEFLGVQRTEVEIERALERSTFGRAQEAMERTARETGDTFLAARRGKVGEWKEAYRKEELAFFGGPAQEAMRQLGYETIDDPQEGLGACGSAEVLNTPSSIQSRIDEARIQFEAGDIEAAEQTLQNALLQWNKNDHVRSAIANCLRALNWTRLIFSDHKANSAQGQRAFDLFRELNQKFIEWPAVRNVLEGSLTSPVGSPKLIEEGYQGFNIVAWIDKYHALDQTLGPVDLDRIENYSLSRNQYMIAASLEEVKGMIDQLVRSRMALKKAVKLWEEAIQNRDFETAVNQLRQLTRDFPDLSDGHLYLARALMQLERIKEAALSFRQAVDLDSQNPALWNQLGFALFKSGDIPAAKKAFENTLLVSPSDIDARVSLAELHRQAGRNKEACDFLKQAARFAPGDIQILIGVGTLGLIQGDPEACSLALEPLSRVQPNHFLIRKLERFLGAHEENAQRSVSL